MALISRVLSVKIRIWKGSSIHAPEVIPYHQNPGADRHAWAGAVRPGGKGSGEGKNYINVRRAPVEQEKKRPGERSFVIGP